jgi:hypothetical protein
MFMKRLFGGATLLCAAFSADAGLIRADFSVGLRTGTDLPRYGSLGAGYELDGSDFLPNDGRPDKGEAWLSLGRDVAPMTATLARPAQDRFDFQASGTGATGITFLAKTPATDAAPIPEPATLAFFGLAAGALGLARQGKSNSRSKRA